MKSDCKTQGHYTYVYIYIPRIERRANLEGVQTPLGKLWSGHQLAEELAGGEDWSVSGV